MTIITVLVVQSPTTDDVTELKNEFQTTEPKTKEPEIDIPVGNCSSFIRMKGY